MTEHSNDQSRGYAGRYWNCSKNPRPPNQSCVSCGQPLSEENRLWHLQGHGVCKMTLRKCLQGCDHVSETYWTELMTRTVKQNAFGVEVQDITPESCEADVKKWNLGTLWDFKSKYHKKQEWIDLVADRARMDGPYAR